MSSEYDPTSAQSAQKLNTYCGYLNVYLHILLALPYVKNIHVYDLMAGKGVYDGSPGSAVLARNICISLMGEYPGKRIFLHLNEGDTSEYEKLRQNVNVEAHDWISCENSDVNKSISNHCRGNEREFKLFFIDPFGYTQLNKQSIDMIVSGEKSECILFVPVSYVFRFISKDDPEQDLIPGIAKFVEDFNIDVDACRNAGDLDQWIKVLREGFVRTYRNNLVGACRLNADKNVYSLVFVGKNMLGLEKFLEVACSRADEKIQLSLFPPESKDMLSYLSTPRNNVEIYKWTLKDKGWALAQTRKMLNDMEKNNQIFVESCLEETKSRKSSFYLTYADYTKSPPKIMVSVMPLTTQQLIK